MINKQQKIILPSIVISGSIAQPGKTRVFPPGFSRAVNTLPTLELSEYTYWLLLFPSLLNNSGLVLLLMMSYLIAGHILW